ncbi:DUF805 domain-containing protein [bacterium]|nr:DUF805 domain-containing protein [bacterium]
MKWYFEVLTKYATFTGRARRTEYWMFVLFNILIGMVLGFIEGSLGIAAETDTSVLGGLYSLAVFVPSLAVGVRRLHDTNRSGWWLLLSVVPLANIALLFFFIEAGTSGANQFGSDPKAEVSSPSPTLTAAAGWLPDPTGRHQLRYWDAVRWTHHVSDNGTAATDPV